VETLVERLVAPAEPWPGAAGGSGGGRTADLLGAAGSCSRPRHSRCLLTGGRTGHLRGHPDRRPGRTGPGAASIAPAALALV